MLAIDSNDEYNEVLPALLRSNSVSDAVNEVRDLLKLDHITYHLAHKIGDPLDNPFVRTTYPPEWVSHYLLNNLASIDPVVQAGMTSADPFFWCDLETTPEAEKMFVEASKFGIPLNGYSVPHQDSKGRGSLFSATLGVENGMEQDRLRSLAEVLQLLAKDFHIKAIAEVYSNDVDMPQLPPRELECLKWCAEGKTYLEIAMILELSEHTVRSYLKSARLRLDCVSLAQAANKASKLKII
ncbi:LuxR family transcriptional regulator [Sulfitobacter sp. F26204]|uniref:LuxR family transcriptional regulator n=1 Tax=Sulfitobacter sp. F26204 TaxID=2996014 RepID=UPI00225E6331|nr:LuxR family transcriptional regulator [Sulfitobacter sp. F26204]MCX7560551.1 LuxR family transcriptional regulator [Sulfitobacter sp. F26204]